MAVLSEKRPRPVPQIIGFCGLAGSGKTTAALRLLALRHFERVRFAGPLKAMMKALGLTQYEIEGAGKELPCTLLGGKTPRQAMQWLGTEWGREMIGPDLWVNAWALTADRALSRGFSVVVDDVRFANEAAAIWQRGGRIVRIIRPDLPGLVGPHVSETQRFPWDAEIINPVNQMADFSAAVRGLMRPG